MPFTGDVAEPLQQTRPFFPVGAERELKAINNTHGGLNVMICKPFADQ
jgi:hypothetical protein